MKDNLIVETVELQQCARDRRRNIPLNTFGSPPRSRTSSLSSYADAAQRNNMSSNNDGVFVEDAEVDQQLRARLNNSKPTTRSNDPDRNKTISTSSTSRVDSDDEDAPLLSPTDNEYGSSHGGDGGHIEEEWEIEDEFRGLPWWKRPSVRLQFMLKNWRD
jgi:hypothetical protein